MTYKFSGHETFPCRYSWLPKAAQEIVNKPALFSNEDDAMVTLGVGKNMVRSIRFWAEAAQIIKPVKTGHFEVTDFAEEIFSPKNKKHEGFDPYLESIETLWLIHWNIATNSNFRIFAWDFFINKWQQTEFSASNTIQSIKRETAKDNSHLSDTNLEQQYEIFIHSYFPTRGQKGEVKEDNLDCPLTELSFIKQVGIKHLSNSSSRSETVYAFNREPKNEISPALFCYCLNDFWNSWHPNELTLNFNAIVNGYNSPGQVFKLPEDDIRSRCESISFDSSGFFEFEESSLQSVVTRKKSSNNYKLSNVYKSDENNE